MPGDTVFNSGLSFWGTNLTLAVLNGTVPAWRVDDMAMRIMAAYFKVGLTLHEPPINFDSWTLDTYGPLHASIGANIQQVNWHVDVRGDHANLIREIGGKATVLLKNVNNTLPLSKPKFVAVIGEDAGTSQFTCVSMCDADFESNPGPNLAGPNGCSDRGCDNGTIGMAWGSGTANFPYLITPDSALQAQAIADGTIYQSIFGR